MNEEFTAAHVADSFALTTTIRCYGTGGGYREGDYPWRARTGAFLRCAAETRGWPVSARTWMGDRSPRLRELQDPWRFDAVGVHFGRERARGDGDAIGLRR